MSAAAPPPPSGGSRPGPCPDRAGTGRFRDSIGRDGAASYIRGLHAAGPIHRDADGFWVVSGVDLVRDVLRDHARFSSSVTEGGYPLLTDDPPRHTALRRLVRRAFAPAAVSAMRPAVEAVAVELVSRIRPGVEVDLIAALAAPLPVRAIAGLLGVPGESRERFVELAGVVTDEFGVAGVGARRQAGLELRDCLRGCLAERRARPAEGVIGSLAAAQAQGEPLSDDDLLDLTTLLLIAGAGTTANLIGSVIHRAVQPRPGWRRLRREPRLAVGLVDEVLRLDAPVQFVPRRAVADTTLAGRSIRRGEKVVAYLAAANRDPDRWGRAGAFDAGRSRQPHLAFGHGIHFCLGAPLARLEAETALRVLLRRFRRAGAGRARARRRPSGMLYGFRELPLVFS